MLPSKKSLLLALFGGLVLATPSTPCQTTAPPIAQKHPNIVLIALDDVGFSNLGCYGSEIHTPSIDSIARNGLRYTHFDTKAICSPTRASLLTGRNNQTIRMCDLASVRKKPDPSDLSNTKGEIPSAVEFLPEALRRFGYATFAVGKWHLSPEYETGKPGDNASFPLQRGFDSFYGYKLGWTDQYHPELFAGNDRVPDPYRPGYYLAEDLAQHAIQTILASEAQSPDRHFFLYLAFTFAHTPLQAPKEFIDHYAGTYQKGWDAIRAERFAHEKRMGLIPANTRLPPRNPGDPAWSSLTPQQQRVYARFMATYAGYIEHGDAQIGRLLAYLKQSALDQNTIVVLLTDNGAASESKPGAFRQPYGDKTTPDDMDQHLDELGGPTTEPLYQRPWAMAGVTPFRRYKLWPYLGGVRTPLMISWPGVIKDPGAIRTQWIDIIDVAPTLLEATGAHFDTTLDGQPQIPVAGVSFLATLTSARAPSKRTMQFFELRGNRAITSGRWRAVAMHRAGTEYVADQWQLFDTVADPSESRDLASKYPAKLRQLQALWQSEAGKYGDLPLVPNRFAPQFSDAFLD
jgi:arylsulfatase